jgi:hypothetical protein
MTSGRYQMKKANYKGAFMQLCIKGEIRIYIHLLLHIKRNRQNKPGSVLLTTHRGNGNEVE